MNKLIQFSLILFLAGASWYFFSSHTEGVHSTYRSGGPSNFGMDRTGAPFSQGVCSACHSGGSGTTNITVTVFNSLSVPVTSYLPGETYTVEFTINNPSFSFYGFQSVAAFLNNTQAGNFTAALTTNSHIGTLNARQYPEHLGVSSTGVFQFTWVAPASGSGTVFIYAIGNAVNNNGGTSGDKVSSPISVSLNEAIPQPNVNITAFIEGYYVNGSSPPAMAPARYDNLLFSGSSNPGNPTDVTEMTAEFWSNGTTLNFTATEILSTNGNLSFTLPAAALGNSYWIAMKSPNTLKTWSSSSVVISSTTNYNFSSALSQAATDGFAPPMALLAPNLYGFYSGDLNQDEFIDGTDYSIFELDVNSSGTGVYSLAGDLNGDAFVDGTDYPIFDQNSFQGLFVQYPTFL